MKGPLKTTNIVVWHLGWGMQLTPPGNFRLEYLIRKKAPGLYPPNSLNIPDTVQRLHWEPERAQELGLPTSYDYGGLRETWLCHLVTDWMGDDAWLWKFECQHRRFNFIGDTTWLTGEVVDKVQTETPQGIRSEVHLEIRCTNQRGVVTSPGKAVVLLPSREHGDVVLPSPPVDEPPGHARPRDRPPQARVARAADAVSGTAACGSPLRRTGAGGVGRVADVGVGHAVLLGHVRRHLGRLPDRADRALDRDRVALGDLRRDVGGTRAQLVDRHHLRHEAEPQRGRRR